ncbi:FeoA family protein [Enorma burkinafasonensis]|uniref:FeoA family protein n=1 Tax=Enorma burkinafasonensis TaxID=2590867 RepID=UPI00119DCE9A|nr:FeoA family protein [Enorma burkinafasonensis]
MLQGPGLPAMPLSLVAGGDTVTVTRVRGGEDLKRRLADLGFVEGSEVHVVSTSGSNVIVTVKGARFGLDAKVASHVMTA